MFQNQEASKPEGFLLKGTKLTLEHYENVAILVDGGFYRRRAFNLFGDKSPKRRAHELVTYCARHLSIDPVDEDNNNQHRLYRIFYYDCPPSWRSFVPSPIKEYSQHERTRSIQLVQ